MSAQAGSVIQEHYHVFDTRLGGCGIAWNERGVTRLQLPERTSTATERRLRARSMTPCAGVPTAPVRKAIAMLERYFAGERVDFADVAIDLGGVGPFHRKVYDATRALPWGQTASYGDLARQAGSPGAARAVGQAMGHNPCPLSSPATVSSPAAARSAASPPTAAPSRRCTFWRWRASTSTPARPCCQGCCRRDGDEEPGWIVLVRSRGLEPPRLAAPTPQAFKSLQHRNHIEGPS